MKTRALLALAALPFLAGAAAGGWYWYQARSGDGEVKYGLANVERGPLAAVVVASGTLNAVSTVQVGSPISGQVKEIYADFNTPVKKDQVIARIDPATFELRVNQAQADVDAARQAFAAARSAKTDDLQLKRAAAAVRQRESLLHRARAELERTAIRAPVDGTVILRNVDAGQTVAGGVKSPVLFAIAQDLSEMQIEAAVGEADVARLRVGMPASFTVEAFPRRSFAGEVSQIRKSLQSAQNTVSYTVVISAPNPDLALLPGMTANVRVTTESRDGVLKVSNAALRWLPAGTQAAKPPPEAALGRVFVLEGAEVVIGLGVDAGERGVPQPGPGLLRGRLH